MHTGLQPILNHLRARLQHSLDVRRSQRDLSALRGLTQHELNDLAIGSSELPAVFSAQGLQPDDLRRH